jgi:DNA helicase-2/ATP-dependent DNA helicase PcrA
VQLAVDLHLHSRHAGGVSPAMTVPNIAAWAQRKGLDLLGTGDCLQADWLHEIERTMTEAEPGLLTLRPEIEEVAGKLLSPRLRRPLRFVLSTEVCCAPPGTPELGGLHHLIYFPSLDSAWRFRERMMLFGDLQEGRPTLAFDSRQLLAAVIAHDEGCRLAPAHVFNPWYSSLGSVSGEKTLTDVFGEYAPKVVAAEMGLTSIPPMCRRVSDLDRQALFCCSDAHSLENLGREYTLMNIVPSFTVLFDALRTGSGDRIHGFVKFPLERTRYYRNRCGVCKKSFDGKTCPRCGRPLAMGSRDRLEVIANRSKPSETSNAPPCRQLLPLSYVIAEQMGVARDSKSVRRHYARLLDALGDERRILTEATQNEIADAGTPQLARAIVAQRTSPPRQLPEKAALPHNDQLSLGL